MFKTICICTTLALAIAATCAQSQAAPNVGEYKTRRAEDDLMLFNTADDESEVFNLLIPYRPLRATEIERRRDSSNVNRQSNNMVPSESDVVFDETPQQPDEPKPVAPSKSNVNPDDDSLNMDKIQSIAFNNREVKLVGPERKPVVVSSDVASQMALALDNLQKETTEVWGQVNEKLDEGWTSFKAMLENAAKRPSHTAPSSASRQLREAPSKNYMSPVSVSDVDGYSMADDDSSSLSKQAETAGAKIKGFLSNIGLNEENGKKANEALSKAGASVSETVTKDIPDALKKAGSKVSDTVTKDIPDAFKNFFG